MMSSTSTGSDDAIELCWVPVSALHRSNARARDLEIVCPRGMPWFDCLLDYLRRPLTAQPDKIAVLLLGITPMVLIRQFQSGLIEFLDAAARDGEDLSAHP